MIRSQASRICSLVLFALFVTGVGESSAPCPVQDFGAPVPYGTYCVATSSQFGGYCPCSNPAGSATSEGCRNSTGQGALLTGTDTQPHVSNDQLVLTATHLPAGFCLFFQGDASPLPPVVAGDGIRCTGGNLIRLMPAKAVVAGSAHYPTGNDPRISLIGNDVQGSDRFYQCYYRDASGPCGSTFNMTNSWHVGWIL
jgi:hypothetical protein